MYPTTRTPQWRAFCCTPQRATRKAAWGGLCGWGNPATSNPSCGADLKLRPGAPRTRYALKSGHEPGKARTHAISQPATIVRSSRKLPVKNSTVSSIGPPSSEDWIHQKLHSSTERWTPEPDRGHQGAQRTRFHPHRQGTILVLSGRNGPTPSINKYLFMVRRSKLLLQALMHEPAR